MGHRKSLMIARVLLPLLVLACRGGNLDRETALKLAKEQQDRLAASWTSDRDRVEVSLRLEIEGSNPIDPASKASYPKGRFAGAKFMQKVAGANGVLKLVKTEQLPASEYAPARQAVEYGLAGERPTARYDPASRRTRIAVTTPVILSIEEFVQQGTVEVVARVDVGFQPTSEGAALFAALEEMRKDGEIDARRLYSPGDELIVQLLQVEENLKRHEARYLRFERTDAGWQVARVQ